MNKQLILLLLETQKLNKGHQVLERVFRKCEMWQGPKRAQVKPQPYQTKCWADEDGEAGFDWKNVNLNIQRARESKH